MSYGRGFAGSSPTWRSSAPAWCCTWEVFTTDRRLELHQILKKFCPNVYFQPGNNITLTFPAIVYQRSTANTRHADNQPYNVTDQYEITAIDRDPDSGIHRMIATLPSSRHNRFFISDGLNHDVFSLFF